MALRSIFDPESGEKIDQALVTFFQAPASFTGEDICEVTVHGGRGVISAIGAALAKFPSVRQAQPGEFTRRAYAAGKMDLTQAEAIADLIDSETEFQRRQALRLLDGGLGRKAEAWRARLLSVFAQLESALDFSDEGDVGRLELESLGAAVAALSDEMRSEISAGSRSLALRNGFTAVISGPPNVGKSTLFNVIAGREIAIVTEHAGTTRDLLRVELDLDGIPVTIVDSAGVREAVDPIEKIGIARAQGAVASADLVLQLNSGDADPVHRLPHDPKVVHVWSKSDLFAAPAGIPAISVSEPDSISRLVALIRERALAAVGDGSEGSLIRQRHMIALQSATDALDRLRTQLLEDRLELAAEECRHVNRELGTISGAFGVEEVLGEIFGRFCIGK